VKESDVKEWDEFMTLLYKKYVMGINVFSHTQEEKGKSN
jgi:hypothetical protein